MMLSPSLRLFHYIRICASLLKSFLKKFGRKFKEFLAVKFSPEESRKWARSEPEVGQTWAGSEQGVSREWAGSEPEVSRKWAGSEPEVLVVDNTLSRHHKINRDNAGEKFFFAIRTKIHTDKKRQFCLILD